MKEMIYKKVSSFGPAEKQKTFQSWICLQIKLDVSAITVFY